MSFIAVQFHISGFFSVGFLTSAYCVFCFFLCVLILVNLQFCLYTLSQYEVQLKDSHVSPGTVAHVCNPSTLGG